MTIIRAQPILATKNIYIVHEYEYMQQCKALYLGQQKKNKVGLEINPPDLVKALDNYNNLTTIHEKP